MTAPTKAQIEACADRPSIRPVCLANIPNALRDLDQWVLWSYEKARGRDGWTKVPFRLELVGPVGRKRPFRYPASSTDPDTWTDYESVAGSMAANEESGRVGAGLVLSANGIVCIDLDDCRNRDTGELTAESLDLVRRLDSYTEVSPSGTGIKIFVLATKPGERCKHTSRKIELYDRARFVAITGDCLPGTNPNLQPRQAKIDALYADLFPALAAPTAGTTPTGHASTPFRPTDLSDAAILDRATNAANGFKFDSLWRGDTSHHNHDKSAADAALASMLAFWTQDAAQISRLMWASGLVRDKWRDRKGYLDTTVARALEGCRAHYGDGGFADSLAAELAGLVGATVTEEANEVKPASTTTAGGSTQTHRPRINALDALADLEAFAPDRGQPGHPDYWQEEREAAAKAASLDPGTAYSDLKILGNNNSPECRRARVALKGKLDPSLKRLVGLPCMQPSCPICLPAVRWRTYRRFAHHLGKLGDVPVYITRVLHSEWKRKRLGEQAGQFGRVLEQLYGMGDNADARYLVASTKPLPGSTEMKIQDALAVIDLAIQGVRGGPGDFRKHHPFAFCRAWGAVVEDEGPAEGNGDDRPKNWEIDRELTSVIAQAKRSTEDVAAILDHYKIKKEESSMWFKGGRREFLDFEMPRDKQARERLMLAIVLGDAEEADLVYAQEQAEWAARLDAEPDEHNGLEEDFADAVFGHG